MKSIYKFLNISNHKKLSEEVYDYLGKRTKLLSNSQPIFFTDLDVKDVIKNIRSVREFLARHNLVAKRFMIIMVPPDNQTQNLHFDRLEPYVRILWPIRNCQSSTTKFFNSDPAKARIEYLENKIPYYVPGDFLTSSKIDQFKLTQPLVFDSSVAHSVHTTSDVTKTRISFSIGFEENLEISQSVDSWSNFHSEIQ